MMNVDRKMSSIASRLWTMCKAWPSKTPSDSAAAKAAHPPGSFHSRMASR